MMGNFYSQPSASHPARLERVLFCHKKARSRCGHKTEEVFCLKGLCEVNAMHRVAVAEITTKTQAAHTPRASADRNGVL